MEAYKLSQKEVLKELQGSPSANGLSEQEASSRLQKYGRNEIKVEHKISRLLIFFQQFNSPVVFILMAALVVSAFLREVVDSIAIASILLLNGIFGFVQEYKAERSIEALKKLESLKARVLREGEVKEIDSALLVLGDIVLLEVGDKVPADCRLMEEKELKTQEAILTGESTAVSKNPVKVIKENVAISEQENMVFSGTSIVNGKGKAIVTATGMQTEIGKIASLLKEIVREETPLQAKVKKFGKVITIAVILIALIVFFGGFLKGGDIIDMLLIGVSLAVAAIPEGLVVVMTISLAFGTQRMIKRNALMRKLAAVETLGSTTVICADKTGTITKNEMTVRKIYVNKEVIEVTGRGYEGVGEFLFEEKEIELKAKEAKETAETKEAKGIKLLLKIGCLNNNATLHNLIGDPTEIALIVSAEKAGMKKEVLEREYPRVDEVLFTSERKMMTTVHKTKKGKESEEGRVVFTKGAVEVVLALCDRIYENGEVRKISDRDKKEILKINEKFASQALRVLAFAFKPFKERKERRKKEYESKLIFLGLQAMIDPPRIEVKQAIEKCKQAGIDVKMITGDHALTAKAIAEEIGIKGEVITGKELEMLSDDELLRKVKEISVFARVNPEHKLRIIDALQKKQEVVAMTGDGVNDAPALKKADIGIAVGSGTDVAKEASDMILVDNNFASIVAAIEEGRGVYDNIKKFTNYLLSSNLGEVLIIFLAILLGFKVAGKIALPLIAIQLLWINLVTDGLPALALGADPVSEDIMKRKPRKKNDEIISKTMAINILLIGLLIAAISILLFSRYLPDVVRAQTIVFTLLVVFESVRAYMIKAQYGRLFNNKSLLFAIAIAIILQIIVIYSPINAIFSVTPLEIMDWFYIIAATAAFAVVGFASQAFVKKVTKEVD